MSQDGGESHEVVRVLCEELVGEGMPQEMGSDREAAEVGVLAHDADHRVLVEGAALSEEEFGPGVGPGFQIGLEASAGLEGHRHGAFAASLGDLGPDEERAAFLGEIEVAAQEAHQLADAHAGEEEQEEDGLVAQAAMKLEFLEEAADIGRVEGFRSEGLPPDHRHAAEGIVPVRPDQSLLDAEGRVAFEEDEPAIDGGRGHAPSAEKGPVVLDIQGGKPQKVERLGVDRVIPIAEEKPIGRVGAEGLGSSAEGSDVLEEGGEAVGFIGRGVDILRGGREARRGCFGRWMGVGHRIIKPVLDRISERQRALEGENSQ